MAPAADVRTAIALHWDKVLRRPRKRPLQPHPHLHPHPHHDEASSHAPPPCGCSCHLTHRASLPPPRAADPDSPPPPPPPPPPPRHHTHAAAEPQQQAWYRCAAAHDGCGCAYNGRAGDMAALVAAYQQHHHAAAWDAHAADEDHDDDAQAHAPHSSSFSAAACCACRPSGGGAAASDATGAETDSGYSSSGGGGGGEGDAAAVGMPARKGMRRSPKRFLELDSASQQQPASLVHAATPLLEPLTARAAVAAGGEEELLPGGRYAPAPLLATHSSAPAPSLRPAPPTPTYSSASAASALAAPLQPCAPPAPPPPLEPGACGVTKRPPAHNVHSHLPAPRGGGAAAAAPQGEGGAPTGAHAEPPACCLLSTDGSGSLSARLWSIDTSVLTTAASSALSGAALVAGPAGGSSSVVVCDELAGGSGGRIPCSVFCGGATPRQVAAWEGEGGSSSGGGSVDAGEEALMLRTGSSSTLSQALRLVPLGDGSSGGDGVALPTGCMLGGRASAGGFPVERPRLWQQLCVSGAPRSGPGALAEERGTAPARLLEGRVRAGRAQSLGSPV